MKLQVYSDIAKLNAVLLHRPGEEIENLTPNTMERLLFDDIPFLESARREHDAFAKVLKDSGAEVFYLEELMAEVLAQPGIKEKFIADFMAETGLASRSIEERVVEFYHQFTDPRALVDKMMAGIRKSEIKRPSRMSLYALASNDYPLYVDPMPNLYFTRDPFSTVGRGIALNRMHTPTRNRETIFAKYIFEHHPLFRDMKVPFWYDRTDETPIEGGDVLVLSPKVVAVGISARTSADSIERLAQRLFASEESFETVLAFDIPKRRAFMHLDTVFTMIDHHIFTIHPGIEAPLSVFALNKTGVGTFDITHETGALDRILAHYLGVPEVLLIRCGGGLGIAADREQWNDGSNTLAIAPGEVVVYDRNHVTNRILRDYGIKLHEIPSAELSRGRGGPRCMSMALSRG
ncbi:MAG: arginine deiminase [Bacillota bacterium]|nr:arginine deiminase [Bacillota bacterium]